VLRVNKVVYIGPRHDATCANVVSLNGSVIAWTNELRYLGVHIIGSRLFKFLLVNAKKVSIVAPMPFSVRLAG